MNVYPILLNNLQGRRCVVFGGDHEAERKALELAEHGAHVFVINPTVSEALSAAAGDGRIVWERRYYAEGDLRRTFLAIVSCLYEGDSRPIWEESQRENTLINAMDDIPYCTFVAGSVVRRGPLVITISTSGCAPALAVRLRQRFEQEFGPEYGEFLEMMGALRDEMKRRFPDFAERKRRWYDIVDGGVLELLQENDRERAEARLADIVQGGERPPAPHESRQPSGQVTGAS